MKITLLFPLSSAWLPVSTKKWVDHYSDSSITASLKTIDDLQWNTAISLEETIRIRNELLVGWSLLSRTASSSSKMGFD
jgi:hypothetical protein